MIQSLVRALTRLAKVEKRVEMKMILYCEMDLKIFTKIGQKANRKEDDLVP